jgi:hypothetical protein
MRSFTSLMFDAPAAKSILDMRKETVMAVVTFKREIRFR